MIFLDFGSLGPKSVVLTGLASTFFLGFGLGLASCLTADLPVATLSSASSSNLSASSTFFSRVGLLGSSAKASKASSKAFSRFNISWLEENCIAFSGSLNPGSSETSLFAFVSAFCTASTALSLISPPSFKPDVNSLSQLYTPRASSKCRSS